MTATHGSREGTMTMNSQRDLNYWHDRMKEDVQFTRYMAEVYKKQQLDLHVSEQTNKKVTHHTRSSSFSSPIGQQHKTRHLPQLMAHPISSPPLQQYDHFNYNRTAKAPTDHPIAPPYNQTSSTP